MWSAERTRLHPAIERLLIAIETGEIGPRDPIFAKRMSDNRSALVGATSRVSTLVIQLARGSRRITADTVARIGKPPSGSFRDDPMPSLTRCGANRRDDDYGGSLASRLRFPLEVFDAVRAAVSAD